MDSPLLFILDFPVFLFFRFRNAIGFRSPLPQVNHFAALGTKWAVTIGGIPHNGLAALGAVGNGLLHEKLVWQVRINSWITVDAK